MRLASLLCVARVQRYKMLRDNQAGKYEEAHVEDLVHKATNELRRAVEYAVLPLEQILALDISNQGDSWVTGWNDGVEEAQRFIVGRPLCPA